MRYFNKKTVIILVGCVAAALLLYFLIIAISSEESEEKPASGFNAEIVTSSDAAQENRIHIYQQYSDALTIDTDIPASVPKTVDSIYADYVKFDEQTLVNMFMPGESPAREESDSFIAYRLDDGSYLGLDGGLVLYRDYPSFYHLKLATENFFTEYNFAYSQTYSPTYGAVYNQDELPFMTSEEAVANVRNMLDPLTITLSEETEVYAIDHETMQAYQDSVMLNDPSTASNYALKEVLTAEDDLYLICFRTQCNGLSVTAKDYDTLAQGRYIAGSSVEVFYSAKGIVNLSIRGAYRPLSTAASTGSLITAQQALEIVAQTKNTMINFGTYDETIKLIDCRLEYIGVPYNDTIGAVLLTPAWNITVAHTLGEGEGSMTYCEVISINAVTGDEIN